MAEVTNGTLQTLRAEGIDVYDSSMIGNAIGCGRKFEYKHVMGLVPKGAGFSYSLEFGRSQHKGLELWYPTHDDSIGLAAFQHAFKGFEEPPGVSRKTQKEISATYTMIFGSALQQAYYDKYRGSLAKMVANEVPLAEELDTDIYLAGRIDKIMEQRELFFRDHKTSKYPDSYQLNPNLQFMTYKFLCQKFTGEKVAGELDMLGVSKSKSVDQLLRQEPFDYSYDQMQNWKDSVINIINTIHRWRKDGFYPQSWRCSGPLNWFRECEYLPLCTSAVNSSVERKMQSAYEVKFWDPFDVGE